MRSNERKKMNIDDFFIEKYKELDIAPSPRQSSSNIME